MISELFIGLLSPKGCSTSVVLMPQNFGGVDLTHHFANPNPAGGGLLGGLYGVAVVQGVSKIEVLLFSQQAAVSGNPRLQLDLDVEQGLCPWAWRCPSAQVWACSNSKCSSILLRCPI